jgi:glutathionylspermidine amidase/synthetase
MKNSPQPFGTLLGYAPGNIPVYSSDYDSVDPAAMPDRHAYRHHVNGIYTGYKWQCVEFARRWLLENKGYVFEDIAMAYDIFRLHQVKVIDAVKANSNSQTLSLKSFTNGAKRPPEPGCMLIWDEGGEFELTGHVAIVTEVFPDRVRVAEQNVSHHYWPENQHYARELPARMSDDGSYWIKCSFDDANILGWVIQTEDEQHSITFKPLKPELLNLKIAEVDKQGIADQAWLNIANPDEAAYVATNGQQLATLKENERYFFCLSTTAQAELKRATNELHALFMHATDYVLQHPHLLKKFNIPTVVWPRIQQSWSNRRNQMITGRFDFCMTEKGLKVYEYNADSASCHMECGKVQGLWAKHVNCDIGSDAGDLLFKKLVDAWEENDVDDLLHIMLDHDKEESYHALFMQSAMEKAGIKTRLIYGIDNLAWSDNNEVIDSQGTPIRWVWKTWAWETALDQLREEMSEEDQHKRLDAENKSAPTLMDVLFRPNTMVIEPLWTLIPSNKAILPILWEMFPNHPYLLESQFELTPTLQREGYVSKPIAGRCGLNVTLYGKDEKTLDETEGRFDEQDGIFQALCCLPTIPGVNVQVCTFNAGGSYAGACVRVDSSLIITNNSDIMPLRVVPDKFFLTLP